MEKGILSLAKEQLERETAFDRLTTVTASLELMRIVMNQSDSDKFYKDEFEKYYKRAKDNFDEIKDTVVTCVAIKDTLFEGGEADV